MHKQEIIQKKISNGLNLIFLKDARYTTSSILFGFNIGWRNDPVGYEGLAHLFEHLVGKRTKKYKNKSSFDKYKEGKGIKSSAMTYPNYTYYIQNQSHENLVCSLELMFESIYNTNFTAEDLENEKKVVLTEAGEYLDNDTNYSYFNNRKNIFNGTSISRFFFGDKKTLKNISLKTFEEFYKYCRNPQNSFLIISCNEDVDINMLQGKIESLYEIYKDITSITAPIIKDSLLPLKEKVALSKKRKQALLLFSFRGNNITIDKKINFDFVRALLSEGFNSRVISKLRDKLGLIYWVYVNLLPFPPFYEITVETSTEKKNIKTVSGEIANIVDSLVDSKQTDIDDLKEIIKYNVLAGINSSDDAIFALTSLLEYNELITTEKYLQKIEELKVDTVVAFINEIRNQKARFILS